MSEIKEKIIILLLVECFVGIWRFVAVTGEKKHWIFKNPNEKYPIKNYKYLSSRKNVMKS